jgi:hypothetical protein
MRDTLLGKPADPAPPDLQPVQGNRKIPFVAMDHEISYGRDIADLAQSSAPSAVGRFPACLGGLPHAVR